MLNRTLLVVLAALGITATVLLAGPRPSASPVAAAALAAPRISSVSARAAAVPLLSTTLVEARPDELVRLDARRELYESVDALLEASEFEKARRLLDDAQARFGDEGAPQWRDLEQSYRLVADCLERPTARLRARAQAFVGVSEALSLKPRIASACRLAPSTR